MSDEIVVDGTTYPDYAAMTVAMHPDIPKSLKDIWNPPNVDKQMERDPTADPDFMTNDQNIINPRQQYAPIPQDVQRVYITPASDQAPTGNLLDQAKSQYPVLNKYEYGYTENFRPNAGFLEHWQPGDQGVEPNGPNSLDSLRPSALPIDKPGLEIRNPATTPSDVMADIVSHHLVNEDPFVKKTYEDLKSSMTPKQEDILKDQYDYAQKNEGETGTYEDWKQRAGMPAFLRGYAFKQWPDEFNDKAYTPEQKQSLDKMVNYLKGTPSSTMPLGSTEKPAGAFKSGEGTGVPVSFLSAGRALNQGIDAVVKGVAGLPETLQNLPETAVKALKNIVSFPGEVAQGKIPMVDPETGRTNVQAIEKATDLAGLMVGGPAPWAGKLADGTLGSFAGVKSKTVDKNALAHAQVLESNGVHSDDILRQTGFARGADNRWRYEIDDSRSYFESNWAHEAHALEEKQTVQLSDILVHPDLYDAYPWLKTVRVKYDPEFKGAQWDTRNTITMGPAYFDNQGILMHEIQHAIQGEEGFAKGGAPGKAGVTYELKLAADMAKLHPEMEDLFQKAISKGLTPTEEVRFQELGKIATKWNEYTKAGDMEAYKNYMRLSGEVESRNVDTRLQMTAEHRRELPPRATEDVSRRMQISMDKPPYTTAYGVVDPQTGNVIKAEPQATTTFRRAANDNTISDTPRTIGESNAKFERDLRKLPIVDPTEIFKTENALRDQRMKLIDKNANGGWNEVDLARFNKLGKQIADLFGDPYEPVKF